MGLRPFGRELQQLRRELLPRVVVGSEEVGFSLGDVEAAPMDLAQLADAAAGALALASVCGNGSMRVMARTAAVHVGLSAGLSAAEIGAALGSTSGAVRRLRDADIDEGAVRAVGLQLRLRGMLAGSTARRAVMDEPHDRMAIVAHSGGGPARRGSVLLT